MIKTEIIGFCQKINRIVKLMELSDTITQKWRRGHGRCGKGDGGVGARVHNIYKLQKHVLLRHQSYLIVFTGNTNLRFGR
jgi:hypothetical protein